MRILDTIRRYALAAGVALVALAAHFVVGAADPGVIFLTAVLLAAWFWGLGPGLLVALAGALAKAYFVLEPVGSFWFGIDDAGRMVMFVLVSVVVTALNHARRREAEAAARLLTVAHEARAAAEIRTRDNERFLAVTSHELRTPLAAIINWIHVLEAGTSDRETMGLALRAIRQNAKMQARLIDDLLDVARAAAGRLPMTMSRVDLAAVVADAIDTVRPDADAAGVTVSALGHESVPPLRADGQRLTQVIVNLLSNAVRHTPTGGQIEVRLLAGDDRVVLSVRDTGSGIAADFLPHVFEPFRQAGAPGPGLGLGMAIVREVVQLHGGTARVASPGPGRGTTVTITLPLASALEIVGAETGAPSGRRPA